MGEDKKKVNHRKRRLHITRDGVLFMSGLIGIGYETVISKTDRPTLLLLFGAMIGLPAFLNKDEKAKENYRECVHPDCTKEATNGLWCKKHHGNIIEEER